MPRVLPLIVLLAMPATLWGGQPSDDAGHFETRVRAILKAQCWQCHGEEAELQGSLDARLARFLLKGGDSGPAVVPGNHAESLLYQRVTSGEMPPGKKKIAPRDVETIAQWIDAGAKSSRPEPESLPAGDTFTPEEREHWSFQPIRRPSLLAVQHSDLVGLTDRYLSAGLASSREDELRAAGRAARY